MAIERASAAAFTTFYVEIESEKFLVRPLNVPICLTTVHLVWLMIAVVR